MDQYDIILKDYLLQKIQFTFLDKSILNKNFSYVDVLYNTIFIPNYCYNVRNTEFVTPTFMYEKDKLSTYIKEFNIYDDEIIKKYINLKYNIISKKELKKISFKTVSPFFLQVCKLILILNLNEQFLKINFMYYLLQLNIDKINCNILKNLVEVYTELIIPL